MSLHILQCVYAYSRPVLIAVDVLVSRTAVVSLHKRKNMLFNSAVMATPPKSSSDWFTLLSVAQSIDIQINICTWNDSALSTCIYCS
jgi:hypothetical protein